MLPGSKLFSRCLHGEPLVSLGTKCKPKRTPLWPDLYKGGGKTRAPLMTTHCTGFKELMPCAAWSGDTIFIWDSWVKITQLFCACDTFQWRFKVHRTLTANVNTIYQSFALKVKQNIGNIEDNWKRTMCSFVLWIKIRIFIACLESRVQSSIWLNMIWIHRSFLSAKLFTTFGFQWFLNVSTTFRTILEHFLPIRIKHTSNHFACKCIQIF